MSGQYVLLEFGSDPFNTKFEDLEGRSAFTIRPVEHNPNLLVKLTREPQWAQQHPTIMGPNNSFFYFGPGPSWGYLVYGNGPINQMGSSLRQKRDGSSSRYFTAQNGRDYKWRMTPRRMECLDGRTIIAVWEHSQPDDEFHARLTIKHSGLPISTEILTTLTLNRMTFALNSM